MSRFAVLIRLMRAFLRANGLVQLGEARRLLERHLVSRYDEFFLGEDGAEAYMEVCDAAAHTILDNRHARRNGTPTRRIFPWN